MHKAWPEAHQVSGHHSNTHRKPIAELPILFRVLYTCFSGQKFIHPVFKDPQGWRFRSLESIDVLDPHKFFFLSGLNFSLQQCKGISYRTSEDRLYQCTL